MSPSTGTSLSTPAASRKRQRRWNSGRSNRQVEQQAAMGREVRGRLERRGAPDVGGAGHHPIAGVPQLDPDPLAGKSRAEPHRQVDPLGDQVEVTVGQQQLELQVREAGAELRQQRHQADLAEGDRGSEAQGAGGAGGHRPGALAGGRQIVDEGLDRAQVFGPRLGQRHAPGAALEQPEAELRLQARDAARDRGRVSLARPGDRGEAAVAGHRDEQAQTLEIH